MKTRLTLGYLSLISMSLIFIGLSSARIDPESIAAMWLFDEGQGDVAKDSSKNGNDGELVNGPKWVEGKFGEALKFDQGLDHVVVPDSPSLSLTSQISIVAWIYPIGGYAASVGVIVGKDDWTLPQARSYDLVTAGTEGNIRVGISHTGVTGVICLKTSTNNELELEEWNHVAATFDGEEIKLYVNGVEQNTSITNQGGAPEVGPIFDSDVELGIGRAIGPAGYDFRGIIDEVAIFDAVLTAEDISSIMTEGLASLAAAVSPSGKMALTWGDVKAGY